MSSRNRSCGHLVPSVTVTMPPPATLARLAPLMGVLMDCAGEFDAVDEGGTWTAVEFVTWLDVECRTAHASAGALS